MAIAPDTKNAVTLLSDFKSKLERYAGITDFSQSSMARIFSDVFVDQVLAARNEAAQAYYGQQVSRAKGQQLDEIGANKRVTRLGSVFAASSRREQNVAFYVDTGTFGDINGGSSIVIPKGTFVYSEANANELGTTIRYLVTEAKTLASGAAIAYVSVRAEYSGKGHNVGATVLRRHSFSSYVNSANGSLKVLNFYPIMNGEDQESDERYRYRITRHYDSIVSNNEAKAQLGALKIPGVLDVKVISGYFGIGTAAVLVLGADYQSSDSLVAAVQLKVDEQRVPGLKITAVGAVEVTVDMEIQLKPVRVLTAAEKSRVEVAARQAVVNALRSIAIGGTLELEAVGQAVRQQTRGLVTIGQQGAFASTFQNVWLRRGYANSVASERERLVVNSVALQEDEFASLGTLTFTYI